MHVSLNAEAIKERDATYILISTDGLIDISGRKLVQFFVVAKDNDSYVDRAENRKLMRFLEQSTFSLEKGHGPVAVILDGFDFWDALISSAFEETKSSTYRSCDDPSLMPSTPERGVASAGGGGLGPHTSRTRWRRLVEGQKTLLDDRADAKCSALDERRAEAMD